MSDILLDTTTHDIEIENYDFELVTGIDKVVQQIKIRLLFFKGEWFLDTLQGLPFYDDIFVKNPNIPNIDNIIKSEIVNTPNVKELLSYESDYDNTNRSLTITFEVDTLYGSTGTITESIS